MTHCHFSLYPSSLSLISLIVRVNTQLISNCNFSFPIKIEAYLFTMAGIMLAGNNGEVVLDQDRQNSKTPFMIGVAGGTSSGKV